MPSASAYRGVATRKPVWTSSACPRRTMVASRVLLPRRGGGATPLRRLHLGAGRQPLEEPIPEPDPPPVVGVSAGGERDVGGEDTLGTEARVHRLQLREAAAEQSGAGEDHHRQRHLEAHQRDRVHRLARPTVAPRPPCLSSSASVNAVSAGIRLNATATTAAAAPLNRSTRPSRDTAWAERPRGASAVSRGAPTGPRARHRRLRRSRGWRSRRRTAAPPGAGGRRGLPGPRSPAGARRHGPGRGARCSRRR